MSHSIASPGASRLVAGSAAGGGSTSGVATPGWRVHEATTSSAQSRRNIRPPDGNARRGDAHGRDRGLPDLAGDCTVAGSVGIEDEWLEGWDPTPGTLSGGAR